MNRISHAFGKWGTAVAEPRHFVNFTSEPRRDNSRFVGDSETTIPFAGGSLPSSLSPTAFLASADQPAGLFSAARRWRQVSTYPRSRARQGSPRSPTHRGSL